jgi:hypothetical protein
MKFAAKSLLFLMSLRGNLHLRPDPSTRNVQAHHHRRAGKPHTRQPVWLRLERDQMRYRSPV